MVPQPGSVYHSMRLEVPWPLSPEKAPHTPTGQPLGGAGAALQLKKEAGREKEGRRKEEEGTSLLGLARRSIFCPQGRIEGMLCPHPGHRPQNAPALF